LSEAGVRLVVSARRAEVLTKLVGEMESEAVAVDGDIVDPALPQKLIDTAVERFGRLDLVFNNAGIMNVGRVEEVDDEAMARMIRVNYEAVVRMAYAAVRYFKPKGHGDLITTSSILGLKVRPGIGVYAGTKFAVEAMSDALRIELAGTGVRVMVVEPGYTSTNLQSHWTHAQKEPLRTVSKPVDPEDIGRAVKFMLEQPPHVIVPRLLMVPVEQQI
jgi:NADP-dependent 3-hydroxy acid dehydrogenase YdfG